MKIPFLASDTIEVDVSFYDHTEETKLLAYPTAAAIQELVAQPMYISKAEFLIHYLFHQIKLGTPRYRDYDSVAEKVHLWLGAIGESIDYERGSVRRHLDAKQQLNDVSEHVGEAIGLSVMNRIHGLTEADWSPIPEQRGRGAKPSFDFQIASDGKRFVQVETKGSSVLDNRALCAAVKAQKQRIDNKKAALTALAVKKQDPNPASLRYGTIAVVDARQNGNVRCLLTDPPPEPVDEDPATFRLLSRMRWLRDVIGFLSPRSTLAAALATRIASLEVLRNPFELDEVALLRGNASEFDITPYGIFNWHHSSFMMAKSRVTDGPAGGVVLQLSEQELFFLGIREDLLVMAADQSFEKITDYKAEAGTEKKTVDCTFSIGRYHALGLPPSIKQSAEKAGGYYHFPLSGDLNYSPEGLVFGVLLLPSE